jgi:hypothetical protein
MLLEELRRVLAYPKLADRLDDPGRLVNLLETISDVVEPAERLEVVADETDNRVVEAAVAGAAQVIVTGGCGTAESGRVQGYQDPAHALAMEREGRTDWERRLG